MNHINKKELLKGILLIIGYMLILPLIIVGILNLFQLKENTFLVVANMCNYILSLIILILIYRKSLNKEWKNFWQNIGKNLKIAVFTWLKIICFLLICNTIIMGLLNGIPQNEEINREIISSLPVFSIISMIILGPIIEELLFRKGFHEAFQNKKIFYLVSGIIFGLAHLTASLNFDSIEAFLACLPECLFGISYGGIGYILAKTYDETDNIFVSTTTHMIQNGFSVLMLLIGANL